MRRGLALIALPLLCGACGGTAIEHPTSDYRGSTLSPPVAAPDFSLSDQAGRRVTLAGQRGRFVVVAFLYTDCPDVCPVIAGSLNVALKSAVARRVGLRVLAVSVDPKGDTPAAVRRYVRERRLLPSFRYLSGSREQLQRVWKAFHIAALAGPKGTVTHSTVEFLIDPRGREVLTYGSDIRAAWVVHDLALFEESG